MNVSAINQVSHRGLSNLTKSAILAGAMATSPVTALPANETNNPKTEYTTDMKDMPYYPVLEINTPQANTEKTAGSEFKEWLMEVLLATADWEIVPEFMERQNTPYYFQIPDAKGSLFDAGYENLATDILTALDSNKNGSIGLTPDDNSKIEFYDELTKVIEDWADFEISEDTHTNLLLNFFNPTNDITNIVKKDNKISKLEIAATLYALDAMSGEDGKIAAEDVLKQLRHCNGQMDMQDNSIGETKKNDFYFSATKKFRKQQKLYYNVRAEDFGEKQYNNRIGIILLG